ncbi:MAG: SpaA isopeptide-forming pilin-related protein [Erysipelotrichaceae bacterium]|nr:SpaA isopeptide-forming pilin-related protein [Erysipelotrichaceae bacterium]
MINSLKNKIIISVLLVMMFLIIPIKTKALEREEYHNEDINVVLSRISQDGKTSLNFYFNYNNLKINSFKLEDNYIEGDNGLYGVDIYENGTYPFKVNYSKQGEEKEFEFEVNVDDVKTNYVVGLPKEKELNKLLKANQYAVYQQDVNKTYIVSKLENKVRARRALHNNNKITYGELLSEHTAFHWAANDSYYWKDFHQYEHKLNGKIGYCLEPSVNDVITSSAKITNFNNKSDIRIMPDGTLLTNLSKKQRDKINLIANYGYGYPGHSTKKYKWATQILIWQEIGWVIDDYGTLGKPGAEMKVINKLINDHNLKLSWDNKQYTVKINDKLWLNDQNIWQYAVDKNKTKGIKILDKKSNSLGIQILTEDAKLSLIKNGYNELGTSIFASDGHSQKVGIMYQHEPKSATANFKVINQGSLKIAKEDKFGNKVVGVTFKIWYSDQEEKSWNYTTDDQGEVEIPHLLAGKELSIQEIAVPKHLVLDNNIKKIKLIANKITTVKFINDIKSDLRIIKKDKHSGLAIPNTKFNILDSENNIIKSLLTNNDGYAEINNLNQGKYHIEEIAVPKPYVINKAQAVQSIEIENNHKGYYELIFENDKQEILIEKYDRDTKKPIPDTIFDIYHKDQLITTVKTNSEGIAKVSYLENGKYNVVEKSVPSPYVIKPDDSTKELLIDNSKQVKYRIIFENEIKKVNFSLYKYDAKTKKLLNDAIFEVYLTKNNVKTKLGTYITGGLIIETKNDIQLYSDPKLTKSVGKYQPSNDKVVIRNLKPDQYFTLIDNHLLSFDVIEGGIMIKNLAEGSMIIYKEVIAPKGYMLKNQENNISLRGDDGENITVHFSNDKSDIPSKKLPKTGSKSLSNIIIISGFSIFIITILVRLFTIKK